MNKRCFLAITKNSLFKKAVFSLVMNMTKELELFESNATNVEDLLKEMLEVNPDLILLEDSSPFHEESSLIRLLITKPSLPVIVISEDVNYMHIVRRETVQLSSSIELIEAINQI